MKTLVLTDEEFEILTAFFEHCAADHVDLDHTISQIIEHINQKLQQAGQQDYCSGTVDSFQANKSIKQMVLPHCLDKGNLSLLKADIAIDQPLTCYCLSIE